MRSAPRVLPDFSPLIPTTFGVAVVGGETTTNPGRLWISFSLLGFVPRGKAVLRSGAKVGDAIFVTGELGGSLAGRHLDFQPRLAEARWLAENFEVHAMMDAEFQDGVQQWLGDDHLREQVSLIEPAHRNEHMTGRCRRS